MSEVKLIAFIGPSGAGKSTIAHSFRNMPFMCTITTRAMREGEVDGEDYDFITEEEFSDLYQRDQLVECVVNYGRSYGITQDHINKVLNSDTTFLTVVTMEGYKAIEPLFKEGEIRSIFIDAPLEDIIRRQAERNLSEEEVSKRLGKYEEERATKELCDFCVTNEDGRLANSLQVVSGIIREMLS